eukprot:1978968-Pleurochrysis_carterae.AAC.1
MHVMDVIDDEKLCKPRCGTGIPSLYRSTRTKIGKGANNEVILLIRKEDDAKFILRMPLRDSDTRNWEDARMEARYTHVASERGVSPKVMDMWFVRRSSKSTAQRRGLNMIMEHFTTNLSRLLRYEPEEVLKHVSCLQRDILNKISLLSEAGLFCVDIKPDNTVVRKDNVTGRYECRLIDFGSDYCEHLDLTDSDTSGCLFHLKSAVILALRKTSGEHIAQGAVRKECTRAMLT